MNRLSLFLSIIHARNDSTKPRRVLHALPIVLTMLVAVFTPSSIFPNASAAGRADTSPPGTIKFTASNRLLTAQGTFKRWNITEAKIDRDDASNVSIDLHVEVEIASIDTGNSRRDSHLRTADFFHASKYPTAKLRLYDAKLKRRGKSGWDLYQGKLSFSMHGVRRTYNVEFELADGEQPKVRGKLRINRTSFGVGAGYRRLNPLSVYDPVSISYSATIGE